jgi:hypothetical protein
MYCISYLLHQSIIRCHYEMYFIFIFVLFIIIRSYIKASNFVIVISFKRHHFVVSFLLGFDSLFYQKKKGITLNRQFLFPFFMFLFLSSTQKNSENTFRSFFSINSVKFTLKIWKIFFEIFQNTPRDEKRNCLLNLTLGL